MIGLCGLFALIASVWTITFPGLQGAAVSTQAGSIAGECPTDYYGYNCRHHCHCHDQGECERGSDVARCRSGCEDGWAGPTCQSRNIAFGMPAKIRTRDPDTMTRVTVDGNASTCVTSEPYVPGWIRVDLMTNVTVFHVTVITDAVSPRGWQLYVTDYSDFFFATPCATVRADDAHVQMSCDKPMIGRFLALLNLQGPVAVCELQASVCANYTFGAGCASVCQCADISEVCHPLTGRCVSGCMAGFAGRSCQQACQGSYGRNCATPCGHCEGNHWCDAVTGACASLCQPGWTGINCNISCKIGTYGKNCAMTCGHCLDDASCDPETGHCLYQCQAGWQGANCDAVCQEGTYGQSCQFLCGQCLANSTCDVVTGICPRGCDRGREGLFCTQECLPHNYGLNCLLRCSHCLLSCDSVTGVCDTDGCQAGWRGESCDIMCNGGDFGANCQTRCGYCAEGEVCDSTTGNCPDQNPLCQPGWDGPSCVEPCTQRLWGSNCSTPCGFCERNEPCDSVTGVCPGVCAKGYTGYRCEMREEFKDATNSQVPITLMAAILSVVLTVLVLVLVCLALKWRQEKEIVSL